MEATNNGSKGLPGEAPKNAIVLGALNDQHRELTLAEQPANHPEEVDGAWVHAMPVEPILEEEALACPSA